MNEGPNIFTLSETSTLTNFTEFFSYTRTEFLRHPDYSSVSFLNGCMTNYLNLFLPFIAALSSLPIFCDEQITGFYKWECLRANKRTYFWGKAVGGALLSVTAIIAGIVILGIAVYLRFPPITAYSIEAVQSARITYWLWSMPSLQSSVVENLGIPFHLLRLLFFCLSGLVSYSITFFIAVCMPNKYILLCLPTVAFMLITSTTIIYWPVSEWMYFPDRFAMPFFVNLFATHIWLYFVLVILYTTVFLLLARVAFARKCKIM